jgi:hypothetical protein
MKTNRQESVSFLKPIIAKSKKENGTDIKGAVRDLLTDIRHFCDHNQLDFGKLDKAAHEVYLDELNDDTECVAIHSRKH